MEWRTAAAERGFALALVILLLGLLVLVAYAVAVSARIEQQRATTADHRQAARQNALAAIGLALADLQRHAGPEDRVTGIAGITGLPAGPRSPGRRWTGVWTTGGSFLAWLVSGVDGSALPELGSGEGVVLAGPGTLGADGIDKEHVRVRAVPVELPSERGVNGARGRIGWWIADEGVKLSAVVEAREADPAPAAHALDELIPRLDPSAAELRRVLIYEQLAFVPRGGVAPASLHANFHVIGRAHEAVGPEGDRLRPGVLNVNSDSARYWRGIGATYNRWSSPEQRLRITPATFGRRLARGFAAAVGPGKAEGGPFLGVDAFLASDLLAEALDRGGPDAEQFGGVMRSMLAVRSDTFRIRAYGDSRPPGEAGDAAAVAFCEAIVQRTVESAPGLGRRFVTVSFRWLGADEI